MKTTLDIKTWRKNNPYNKLDLYNANLSDANLSDADLRDADLRDADLRNADLRNADLRDADLYNADLQKSILCDANLNGVKISYRRKKVLIKFEIIE